MGDRGSATVWAAGAIVVLLGLAVLGLHLGAAMTARHHAQAAADLAALAGAAAAVTGERPACAQARRVTDRMRVRLDSCRLDGWDLLVEVSARPGLGIGGTALTRARAGPVTPAYLDLPANRAGRGPPTGGGTTSRG